MRFLMLLLILASCAMPVAACDVNLFAIMAGTTKQDAFSQATIQLVQSIKTLDNSFSDQVVLQKTLLDFMNRWVEFANSFNQFPPEWGRQDPNWQSKFSDLGTIIGEIRRKMVSDRLGVHDEMLKFSRRLSLLYEYMPMSDQARLLLEFTRSFDHLWGAFFAKNRELLKLHVAELQRNCEKLHAVIDEPDREKTTKLVELAERLRAMSTQINAFQTVTLRMTLIAAEGEFINLNEKLSVALKSTSTTE